jgi:Peptidase family M50/Tetratricopeptide repeat
MPSKCNDCGCESQIGQAFRPYKPGLFRRPVMLCPACRSENYISRFKASSGILALVVVGGFLIQYLDPSNNGATLLINLGVIYIFALMMVIPHELGHAIIGTLLGFRIFRVIIGYGRPLLTRVFLGWRWELRPLPIGGVTVTATLSTRFFRLRKFLLIFAGPLVNVICIALPIWLLSQARGASGPGSWGTSLFIDFFMANVLLLGVNLWPHRITTAAGGIENDGLALLRTPFISSQRVDEAPVGYHFLASQELCQQEQYAAAARNCEEGLAKYPNSSLLRSQLGIVFLSMNEHEKARALFSELLEHTDIKPDQRMILLNNIAYTDLMSGSPELLEEAQRCSEQAYRNIPWVHSVKVTRGAVLVETGRLEEGLPLLRSAFNSHTEPKDKAFIAAFIALGENRRGNNEEGVRYFNMARALDPLCKLLNRVKIEIHPEIA